MADTVGGTLGDNVSRAAVGKDIQQVSINLSDKSPDQIAEFVRQLAQRSDRLQIAIVGDSEMGVPGVVARLKQIDEKLDAVTNKVGLLDNKVGLLDGKIGDLSSEVDDLRQRVANYGGSSRTNQYLLYFIAALVAVSVGIALWQMF